MILRDFASCKESVDDIRNITEKRRYILIFKYDSPIHTGLSQPICSAKGNDDIYLINESVIHGANFLVPNGITLMQRNQYRGISKNLFDINGKINMDSEIWFYFGSYSNRIHKQNGEVWRLSMPTLLESCGGLGANSMEEEALRVLNSEWLQPFPEFYNIEDQAHFGRNHSRFVGDFCYDRAELPMYRLNQLCDHYTQIAIIEMPNMNDLINLSSIDIIQSEGILGQNDSGNIKFNNGIVAALGEFKTNLTNFFIDANKYVMDSAFSQVDIMVDTENVSFNIDPTTLKVKFRELTKQEIMDDYRLLAERLSYLVEREFEENNMPSEIYINNLCPNRIMIHIANTGCKIKVTNTYKTTTFKKMNMPIFAKAESSSADVDEMVTTKCSDIGGY